MDAVERSALQRGLVRLRDGDRSAFDGVFALLRPLFSALAHRQLDAEAEDVAQEALLKLFARIGEFDPERDALAWSLGIVANELRTARKRRVRRREDPAAALDAAAAPLASPEEEVILQELCSAARQVLGELRPTDSDVLWRAVRGEREATPTFRKRLERALGRLRVAWSASHGTE
jgi:RNA polymerase sigma-70 factor (ECF subfamily)